MIRTIKIAGTVYPIQYTDKMDIEGAIAYIDFNKQIIVIDNNYPDEMKKLALLHEIIHGVNYAYNAGLEEAEVDKLSRGLYATLKDNIEYGILQG